MKVSRHQYLWLANGYDLEIGHFKISFCNLCVHGMLKACQVRSESSYFYTVYILILQAKI